MEGKADRLREIIKSLDPFLIAFSGGVDSTLLLKLAKDTLNGEVTGVIVDSPTLPRSELEEAKKIAAELGVNLIEMHSQEMELPEFRSNTPQRCYLCKDHRYR